VLLTFLGMTAFAIIHTHHLFAVVMMSGVFSLLSAGLLVMLDAVDVAFTEAAVGAGISTVLMLGTLTLTARREKVSKRANWVPLIVVCVTGAALIYGTLDMPLFGDPNAPSMTHVMPEYIEGTEHIFQIPNVVTAVLGSYRGYDTLGETAVVFTAGIGVILLLGAVGGRKRDARDENESGEGS